MPILPKIKRCQHVKLNGYQCGSPAILEKEFCYWHEANRPDKQMFNLPPLEDGNAVQLAISEVFRAVAHGEIGPRHARILLYALQLASSNLPKTQFRKSLDEKPAREVDFLKQFSTLNAKFRSSANDLGEPLNWQHNKNIGPGTPAQGIEAAIPPTRS